MSGLPPSTEITPEQAVTLHGIYTGARYLLTWCVTRSPRHGRVGRFIARPHCARLGRFLDVCLIADGPEDIRAMLPPALTRISLPMSDDPKSGEIWL